MNWLKTLLKFSEVVTPSVASSIDFLFEEARETDTAFQKYAWAATDSQKKRMYLETIDGFADTAFVALSGMRTMLRYKGLPEDMIAGKINEIMTAVCDANDRKFDGNHVIKNEQGKIMKPHNWVGPDQDLERILG